MKCIFVDTNIFLHYQDIEKIDWLTESITKQCKLIIVPQVIDELDRLKVGTNKNSKKARRALKRLEELADTGNPQISKNVTLEIVFRKPSKSIYEKYDLNFDEYDQRLIASIIYYRDTNAIQDIELCTNDVGPRLRAKQFGINALLLNKKYLLPIQESEDKKKIKKLEDEIKLLKYKIPNIFLSFENSKVFFEFNIGPVEKFDFENFKSMEMNQIKIKYPPLLLENHNVSPLLKGLTISSEQIEIYNGLLEIFYQNYENYLHELFDYKEQKRLSFALKIYLNNSGNIPAKDVDIHLHFPDGFEIAVTNELKIPPKRPEPPNKPTSRFEFSLPSLDLNKIPIIDNISSNIDINKTGPDIRKTNSYDVDYHINYLKHGYHEALESVSIIFNEFSNIRSFRIDYELSAANLPKIIEGKINVIFNIEN